MRALILSRFWLVWLSGLGLLALWFLPVLTVANIGPGRCSAAAAADPDWQGTAPVDLSGGSEYSRPDVASGRGSLVVAAWNVELPAESPNDIYAAFSNDYGDTWSDPEVVSATQADSFFPDALVAGEQVFVSWTEQDGFPTYNRVLYEAEYEGPGNWSVRQIPGSESGGTSQGRLAATASDLFIVFNAGGETNRDIMYASRFLTGTAWTTATVAYTHTGAADERDPAVALGADGETLHAAWDEVEGASYQILYMTGTVVGGNVAWNAPISLTTASTSTVVRPSLAVSADGDVHAVWGRAEGEDTNVFRVEYSRFDSGTGTWLTPTVTIDTDVVVNLPIPGHPDPLVVSYGAGEHNDVCVTWNGFRAEQNAEEIWIRCSEDGGSTWGVVQNVSRTPGPVEMSIWPSMEFGAFGRLHVVWREKSVEPDLPYKVYYARSLYRSFLPLVLRGG